MSEIMSKLKEVLITEIPGIGEIDLGDTIRLREDIGLDSLRLVNILVAVEKKFNIEFDESDLDPSEILSLGDIKRIVKKRISNNNE